jgi:hypothetical protein
MKAIFRMPHCMASSKIGWNKRCQDKTLWRELGLAEGYVGDEGS